MRLRHRRQLFRNECLEVVRRHGGIPDVIWGYEDIRTGGAAVEAAGFDDPDAVLQTVGFDVVTQRLAERRSHCAATRSTAVTRVFTDKEAFFERDRLTWHTCYRRLAQKTAHGLNPW